MGKTKFDKNRKEVHYLHYGSGIPVFHGDVYQHGYGIGGIIARLFRKAVPVITPMLKSGAKGLAKAVLKTGRNVLADIVTDDKKFKDALKTRVGEVLRPPSNTMNKREATSPRHGTKRKRQKRSKKEQRNNDIFS